MQVKGAHVLLISPDPWHGVQLSKHDVARALHAMGATVVFWEPPVKGAGPMRLVDDGPVRRVVYSHGARGVNRLPRALHLWYYRRRIGALERLSGRRFDLIWCFDVSRLRWFPGGVGGVLHLADHDEMGLFDISGLVRTADRVLTVTEPLAVHVRSIAPGAPCTTIGHMVEDAWFDPPLPLPVEHVRSVAYAGQLATSYIDWELILRIMRAHPAIDFHFYGPYNLDWPAPHLRETLTMPNARLHGLVDRANLIGGLRRADLLLLCYRADALGDTVANSHKMLEYLATGRPVVASHTSAWWGVPDIGMVRERELLPALFDRSVAGIAALTAPEAAARRRALAAGHRVPEVLAGVLAGLR